MVLGAAGYHRGDWLSLASEVAALGFGAHNVRVDDVGDGAAASVSRVRGLFEAAGVRVGPTNGGYGGALISPDPGVRRRAVDFVQRMCRLTRQLGAPDTYLRPGSLNPRGAWLPHPDNRGEDVFDRLVDSTRQVCAAAETRAGFMVCRWCWSGTWRPKGSRSTTRAPVP